MAFDYEKTFLPAFPRTPHLPYAPNSTSDDAVATVNEVSSIFTGTVSIEEKIDGASAGMCLFEGNALIRNREHILRKGYFKDTAAKSQFRPMWNWFYDNRKKFKSIEQAGPYSVYGEWCWAQHGIYYNRLPDWFIAYDIYDSDKQSWLAPPIARQLLQETGFQVPVLKFTGEVDHDYAKFVTWANEPAAWADSKAEGIYVKVHDKGYITHRFKMVRSDFVRGSLWSPEKINKNKVVK